MTESEGDRQVQGVDRDCRADPGLLNRLPTIVRRQIATTGRGRHSRLINSWHRQEQIKLPEMNLPSVGDLITILKLKGDQAFALFAFCVVVLLLAHFDLLYLGGMPTWLRSTFVVLGLGGAAVWGVRIWRRGSDIRRERRTEARQAQQTREKSEQAERRRQESQQQVLKELDRLSEKEKAMLGWLLKKETSTASMDWKNETAGLLVSRGLLVRSQELHPRTDWPHSVPDFVWEELQNRRDEFIAMADKYSGKHQWG